MKVIGIIQARMASSRFPGKSLADVEGEPLLGRVIERTAQMRGVEKWVVATSTNPEDDAIAEFCEGRGVPCFRGHPTNVLDRFIQAVRTHLPDADAVVRVTGDSPLWDPAVGQEVLNAFLVGNGEPAV